MKIATIFSLVLIGITSCLADQISYTPTVFCLPNGKLIPLSQEPEPKERKSFLKGLFKNNKAAENEEPVVFHKLDGTRLILGSKAKPSENTKKSSLFGWGDSKPKATQTPKPETLAKATPEPRKRSLFTRLFSKPKTESETPLVFNIPEPASSEKPALETEVSKTQNVAKPKAAEASSEIPMRLPDMLALPEDSQLRSAPSKDPANKAGIIARPPAE